MFTPQRSVLFSKMKVAAQNIIKNISEVWRKNCTAYSICYAKVRILVTLISSVLTSEKILRKKVIGI